VAYPKIYADATALIGLARINRLGLLALLRTPIYVTTRVWDEVAGGPERAGVVALRQAREAGLLAVVAEGDATAYPELDPGESTVLTAAAAARAAVLLDERRARAFIAGNAELRGAIVQVTGVIGLILLARDRGYLDAVKPLLDDLMAQRFRISPALYQDVLRRAGEL
jgi:predicted nucleic acid-binding protein